MNFEIIAWSSRGAQRLDSAHAGAVWREASAELTRHGHPSAQWSLRRACMPGAHARVFVFPTANVTQPPASLWISNLRSKALEADWCEPSDIWAEVVRSGWAGYDFTKIQERSFSTAGGALDGSSHPSWSSLCQASGLPETLLCSMDWEGLPSMWGDGFEQAMARRESLAIRSALAEGAAGAEGSKGKRRAKKA